MVLHAVTVSLKFLNREMSSGDKDSSRSFLAQSGRIATFERDKRLEDIARVRAQNTVEFLVGLCFSFISWSSLIYIFLQVEDPIACGYLTVFCKAQFCAENVYFITEIGKFKDIFAIDRSAWGTKDWQMLDRDVSIDSKPLSADVSKTKKVHWPSTVVSHAEVELRMKWLWDTFFSDSARFQICVPAHILTRTVKRLNLIHIYGGEAYDEALIDPLKTMRRDIFPRFVSADIAIEMQRRFDSIATLPLASTLEVPPPASCPFTSVAFEDGIDILIRGLDVMDVLTDRILYGEFLTYLRSIVSAENLLCIRMIEHFKDAVPADTHIFSSKGSETQDQNFSKRYLTVTAMIESAAQKEIASELAWQIYRYFVHPGSAYEIALSHRRRKELCLLMASPTRDMFDRVEKSALDALKVHYTTFKNSVALRYSTAAAIRRYLADQRAAEEEERQRKIPWYNKLGFGSGFGGGNRSRK